MILVATGAKVTRPQSPVAKCNNNNNIMYIPYHAQDLEQLAGWLPISWPAIIVVLVL
jgi:hypothetical protein